MPEDTAFATTGVSVEAVCMQLERLLASSVLSGSASLRKLLRYVVEETLRGHGNQLKEYTLGTMVFGRGEAYDPRIDPIVRVQARNLRSKLKQYYESEGRLDPMIIELPKGAYLPSFTLAPVLQEPVSVSVAPRPRMKWLWIAAMTVAAVIASLLLYSRGGLPMVSGRTVFPMPRELSLGFHSPVDPDARTSYLQGLYLYERMTTAMLKRSISYFENAIMRDPDYALAYTGLADAHNVLAQFGEIPPSEAMPKARTAALRALELDPNLAEAHVSLGAILEAYDWNWSEAERSYRRAIELNPQLSAAHLWYGMFLRDQGRQAEALPELETAYRLNPTAQLSSLNMAFVYSARGDRNAALNQIHKALEIDPTCAKTYINLALAYHTQSRAEDAAAAFERAHELSAAEPRTLARLGAVYATTGKMDEARRTLSEVEHLAGTRYVSSFDLALLHAAVGHTERAVQLLERAYQERSAGMIYLRMEKIGELRSHPRVRELVSRMRLPG
ncbi:MAG: tetratricopeptide repeat protein [Bryobacterales bacterium]|nr:tetratricopeptide repeat protein [Bryobacterales bacterium]